MNEIKYGMQLNLTNGTLTDSFSKTGLAADQVNQRLIRNVQEIFSGASAGGVSASGTSSITLGASSVTITGAAFGFIPSGIMVSVSKPSGGDNIFATVDESTITADGFTAYLSAPTPASGYTLVYYTTGTVGGSAGCALELGGVVNPGLAIFVNLDPVNWVDIGIGIDGSFWPFIHLLAGQHSGPMFLGTGIGTPIYALANTAPVKLFYIIYDR